MGVWPKHTKLKQGLLIRMFPLGVYFGFKNPTVQSGAFNVHVMVFSSLNIPSHP